MRSAVAPQLPLCAPFGAHKHADLLRRISLLLDQMPDLSQALLCDLVPPGTRSDFGRQGLSAEQVLRILVLYLMLQTDFEQLEFHLSDSPLSHPLVFLPKSKFPSPISTRTWNSPVRSVQLGLA